MYDESGILEIDNFKIFYARRGDGNCVVFLSPGVLSTVDIEFEKQFNGFDRQKFTLVSWDAPGFGRSRPPERDYNDCYHRDAALIVKLMDKLGYNSFSLMGFSDGGRTAMALAADFPEVIKKLVIWGTSAYNSPKELKTLELCRDISGWNNDRRALYEEVYGDDLQEVWGTWVDENEQMGKFMTDSLHKIKCSTFILHGDDDIIAPVEPHALYLKKNIANSKLLIFPKIPHTVHQNKTPEFNRLVQEFLLT